MEITRTRRLETAIYAGTWVLVAVLYLFGIMRARSFTAGSSLLEWSTVARAAVTLLPFVTLFVANNYCLVPYLLLRNRYVAYLLGALAILCAVWGWQWWQFLQMVENFGIPHHAGADVPRHLIPLPLFFDLIYDLLVVGVNLAVALIFRRGDDLLERERLMKANAEGRLAYLKAQINPHFYMNMLNNIHAMIELDAAKAQEMLLDMSHLMRYMLYESAHSRIALWNEIDFIHNYLRLMRQRYPESKVGIMAVLPDETQVAGVVVAPLLFLVFIENAFKHGISYREPSFVSVTLEVGAEEVVFRCINSVHRAAQSDEAAIGPVKTAGGGIGLINVRQRLELLYGDRFSLEAGRQGTIYNVILSIPRQ